MNDNNNSILNGVLLFLVFIFMPALYIVGVTKQNQEIQENIKNEYSLKCYSGSLLLLLLEDTSMGEVRNDGTYWWISKTDGKPKDWNGVCVVTLIK